MEFLNKKTRIVETPKFSSNDIINSVSNIVTDRHYYAEEMVNQAKAIELYVENGKYMVEDVKSGQKFHIPALTPQVKAIIDKYFAVNQNPVDLLISGTGEVIKINPEGSFQPEEVESLKVEIKKSNLWRLTNAQKPEKMAPINEEEEEGEEGDKLQALDRIEQAIEDAVFDACEKAGTPQQIGTMIADSVFLGIEDAFDDDILKIEQTVQVIIKELKEYVIDAKKNPVNPTNK